MDARGATAAGGDPFAALPHALALAIFSRLTVEQRLRCIEVCRGWRATLAEHAAWLQLDLPRTDGSEALLRAATTRAGGQLRCAWLAGTRCTARSAPSLLPTPRRCRSCASACPALATRMAADLLQYWHC
jgi:hypothetical protein